MNIVGRTAEQEEIHKYLHSGKPEFVAVYGRRRVGKTFLIREYFNNKFAFYVTGLANERTQMQLRNFHAALLRHGKTTYPVPDTWFDAFEQLTHLLEHLPGKGRKVIFFDELPWMDTHKSGFITALEHFWNSWASARPEILLIVCGSATSWMVNKLIKNHGGLHNRVTHQMYLKPFTLRECEQYYRKNGIVMNRQQMVDNYMILGGIPYYLSLMEKGISQAQNIDKLCFAPKAVLRDEFSNLYASLFKHAGNHIRVVEALSLKKKGLTREEIIRQTKLPDGGGLTKILEELEWCDFIRKYNTFEKKNKCRLYQLTDHYTLFYFSFIKGNRYNDEHFWTNFADNAKRRAWSGYAFEQVCLSHIHPVKQKLGITGVWTHIASWRSRNTDPGAQIDLLIDRNDGIINLCEIKYAHTPFAIDKKYDENLRNKKEAFIQETKTRKTIHLTLISTYGLKPNEYSGIIQSEVRMDDLFQGI